MFDEDLEPAKKTNQIKDLEPMSISELEEYISRMKEEIFRVEAEIEKKKVHQDAASSLFKS